jgi:hypothetical protein
MADGRGFNHRVYLDPIERGQIQIAYEFSLGGDGLYTGQCYPPFWFGGMGVVHTGTMVGQGRNRAV